jgi:hypothetical protein
VSNANRRQHRRLPAHLLPSLTARLSGGAPVTLLDVSRRGVRLQTPLHMRPGQTVCIRFVAADATVTLSAAVVRASVAKVDGEGIRYETALSLAGDLLLCDQLQDEATRIAGDGEVAVAAASQTSLDAVVDFTVIVDGDAESIGVTDGMHANCW